MGQAIFEFAMWHSMTLNLFYLASSRIILCVTNKIIIKLLPSIKSTWKIWFTFDFLMIPPKAIKMHQK